MVETRIPMLFLPLWMLGGCIPSLPDVADPCAQWDEPGLYTHKIEVDGKKRKAYIQVPPNSEGPRDLVFAIHGAGQNPKEFAASTKYIPLANKEGFVGVFPSGRGIRKSWDGVEAARKVDDVKFLDSLARDLNTKVCGARVLAVGFSFGGLMTHRWACEGNNVDAIVPAAGGVGSPTCSGDPVPVRHYHGDADTAIKYDGTRFGIYDFDLPGAVESMEIWRERNLCDPEIPPETWVDGDVTCQAWSCAVPTELCTLSGWGHRWPGGANRSSNQHDATTESWDWFQSLESTTDQEQ